MGLIGTYLKTSSNQPPTIDKNTTFLLLSKITTFPFFLKNITIHAINDSLLILKVKIKF